MYVVIYQWRLRPGMEEQFAEGWELVTRAIKGKCGSYGSRLHRADDGTYIAYARWPDSETRLLCQHDEDRGATLMSEAIAERFDEVRCVVAVDLLEEPPCT